MKLKKSLKILENLLKISYIFSKSKLNIGNFDFFKMVGRVGYAPTTPAMSMQYSTIELTAQS